MKDTDLKTLQGRHDFPKRTSNEVMQEMAAYKVASKIAQDAIARAIGMQKHASIALKATVEEEDEDEYDDQVELSSETLSSTLTQHMGLAARTF